ncbi:NADP/NADPH phosphatase nocturnin isoform X2 [Rhodnius prolixus]|uniref:NADP/NADPH phosphatase nocturnin isoform X2 n=1 Tax=Rhodnius prolixus TaxID=13249 RepID=UPI003D18F516
MFIQVGMMCRNIGFAKIIMGGGLREGVSMPSLLSIRDSYQVAESLARADLMTSPAARRRLQARRIELGLGEHPGYVPPKHLLLYLVRMGSFNSAPKILNEDTQDNDVTLPEHMSKEDLLTYCTNQLQGTPSLIPRTFRSVSLFNGSPKYRTHEMLPLNEAGIRVLQWNLLSQTLGLNNDNFVRCPSEALHWQRRRNLLTQEIVRYSPDVICLQEVDHFNYLKKSLGTQGYIGMFFPKPDSPCMYIKDNNGPDGCAIFFRSNRFELVKCETRVLEVWRVQSNQVAVLAILRDLVTGSEFCVATTHLKARNGALLAALRNEQGKDLLDFVTSHCGDRPVIVCGDFNAEPAEPVYSTVTTHPALRLASAYAAYQAGEPPYTTWKVREEGEVCHTIDYIFYSKGGFRVSSLLDFPTGEEIGECRVPSFGYPSDHFSLVCDLLPTASNSIQSPL